jgi:predicted alpha-1,6-mannanase (GH76 family)
VHPSRPRRHRRFVLAAVAIVFSAFAVSGSGVAAHKPGAGTSAAEYTEYTGYAARADVAAGRLHQVFAAERYRSRWWESATALDAVIDYMRVSGSRAYLSDTERIFLASRRTGFLSFYYDDEGWWALAWIAAYQLTGRERYLRQAEYLFANMTTGWDNTCGGGIWWNKARAYKNAIANELFLQVAARLHNLTPRDTHYLAWAMREWRWFAASGMLTRSHLVVDGLADCRAMLDAPTWTYNQGVLIGGLVELSDATHDSSLLATAKAVADAVIDSRRLSPRGILREPCESSSCDQDASMFKGIFIENLKLLDDTDPDPDYADYMRRNAAAVWNSDRRGSEFGLHWNGPFDHVGVGRQAAALDALNTQIPGG